MEMGHPPGLAGGMWRVYGRYVEGMLHIGNH
jgi:hypothetical protein